MRTHILIFILILQGCKSGNETIIESSTETLIGEEISFKPNFMGDKNSFYIDLDLGDNETFERWEKTHCDVVKCAKIRTRKN